MTKTIFRLFTLSQLACWITAPISMLMVTPGTMVDFWAVLAIGNTISLCSYLYITLFVNIEEIQEKLDNKRK